MGKIEESLRWTVRGLVSGELPWPLFLSGPAGSGKTCAALCLLDHCRDPAEYFTAAGLCDMLIQAGKGALENLGGYWGTGKITGPQVWERVGRAALVVLDEIGCRDRPSDFAYETLKQVIDDRHGKPLVCVSNHGLEMIEKLYDDRVASRLAAGTVVHLAGKDRRLQR